MYARILVPLDGSSTAQRGFDEALALAQALKSSLHLVNIVDARMLLGHAGSYAPQQLLDDWHAAGTQLIGEALDKARAKGVGAEGAVRCDPGARICDLITREAQDCKAELIVMGTHGRRGLNRLALGSDAELVLRDSAVPVMLVRDPLAQ